MYNTYLLFVGCFVVLLFSARNNQAINFLTEMSPMSPMPYTGLPQEVTVRPHMPSSSQIPWGCYKKWIEERESQTKMVDIPLPKLLLVYCPGHAGVKGTDRANRLAGKATLTSGLLLGKLEVLSLRHYLWAQSQGHHTIDHLEERGVERGSARRSSLKGRERVIVNQTNIGIVSKATLEKPLRDWVERIWAFPSS